MARYTGLPVPPNALQVPTISTERSAEAPASSTSPNAPPDGGNRAWLVVFGSALSLFATTGFINAWVRLTSTANEFPPTEIPQGVFQEYYTQTLLSDSPSSTIALIGGLEVALVYGCGPITGRLFDAYGLNVMFALGTFLVVLSQMLVSICQRNRPYQFFLAQGVLCGMGSAMIFTPALAVVGHWFKRRRAYVFGIVVAGSSLGGLVYPILLKWLKDAVGFPWAVRISGFFTLTCLIVARLTIRTRIPPQGRMSLSQIIDLQGFRDVRYTLTTIASFLYFYGLFIPYFYVEEYANFQGVPLNVSRYLLAIINACGVPARIVPGFLGDRFGVLKVLIPPTVISGAVVLALWLPSRGTVPIVIFSVLYGTVSSGFVSMLPAYVATISPVEKFGARLGTLYFFVAVASLVGTPTAGAFVPTFTQNNFNELIIFTGTLLLMAAAFIGLAHVLSIRGRYDQRDNSSDKSSPNPPSSSECEGRELNGLNINDLERGVSEKK